MEVPTNVQGFFIVVALQRIQAIKKTYKLFNHKLNTVIYMWKSKEISRFLTITSFLLHFLICWTFFLMDDFDVKMENNLNDNVFCKKDSTSTASVSSSLFT